MSEYQQAAAEMCECGFDAFVKEGIYTEQLWIRVQVPGLQIFEEFQIDYDTVYEWSDRYDSNH